MRGPTVVAARIRAAVAVPYRAGRRWLARWKRLPGLRQLRCIEFRRLRPLQDGRRRGTAVVRYYWARFLQEHRADIRGRGLEVGATSTIRRYGGANLLQADAIDLSPHSEEVTVVADLSRADEVPSDTWDCFVNQFTMHLIYDVPAALYHAVRLLKPGGALLVNFPCVDYYFPTGLDMGTGRPLFLYWWFTPIQVDTVLRSLGLGDGDYRLQTYGNLFARIAYQLNVPAEELTTRELDTVDAGHPLLICARIVKPSGWAGPKPCYRDPWVPATTPSRWNPLTGHYGSPAT
jgi:SAM-dependent methyltransferase